MLIKTIPVGQYETNCYIVSNEDTLECVIIDPGDESNNILNYIEDNKLKPQLIFLTHGHWDHTGAVMRILREIPLPVYLNAADDGEPDWNFSHRFPLPEGGRHYGEGDVIKAAGYEFRVMETPGHTPGSVSLIVNDAIFTGDTLFRGSCGRTDMPGGDMDTELRSIKRLCELEGDYEVYPGHMDSSTLERERRFNYYCRIAMGS